MKDRRIGFIEVHNRLLIDSIDSGHGANMFHCAVPLDMSTNWNNNNVRIKMWHPDFEQIEEGDGIPEYVAVFHGSYAYPSFRRVSA